MTEQKIQHLILAEGYIICLREHHLFFIKFKMNTLSPTKLIIFDLDDTLINTSDIYYRVRSEFINLLLSMKQNDNYESLFESIDEKNIGIFGYSPKRYLISMVELYLMLLKENPEIYKPEKLSEIITIGNKISKLIPDLIPGADDLLVHLSKKYRIAILTRGDKKTQMKKIMYHGLDKITHDIFIVDKKSQESFNEIIQHTLVKPKEAWSIGDSPKWDIAPAKLIGLNTILYKYNNSEYTWKNEHRDLPSDSIAIDNLSDVKYYIGSIKKNRSLQLAFDF